MGFTLDQVDALIDSTIFLSKQKNKVPMTFAMAPESRQYLSDAIKNAIESGRPDPYITALTVGFIVGYSYGLEDMSDFAEKVLGKHGL